MFWNLIVWSIIFSVVIWFLLSYKKKITPDGKRLPPGPKPSDPETGNLNDIKQEESLHKYLKKLHEKLGPIVSFWLGKNVVVSTASPELFKQQLNLFDRPVIIFKMYADLLGDYSVQFRNEEEGRHLHKILSRPFSFSECKNYYDYFHTIAHQLIQKIENLPPKSPVPVHQYMNIVAIKGIFHSAFGYNLDDDEVAIKFMDNYNIAFNDLENIFKSSMAQNVPKEEVRKALQAYKDFAAYLIENRLKTKTTDHELFVDLLLNSEEPKESQLDNAITFITGGFHTTANLLAWLLYYTAKHQDIQEKLYLEMREVLGDDKVTPETMKNLRYTQQVIDETLRITALAGYAARYSTKDIVLGGYHIPANTAVLQALGVILTDEKYWPSPEIFDPDRFLPENAKHRPPLIFSPFGFAGKRICPGNRIASVESTIMMTVLLRRFKFHLADEQQRIEPMYGIVTKPSCEMWMNIESRQ